MTRWWADTLFKRLFLLMWAGLVASHLLAFGLTRWLNEPGDGFSQRGPGGPGGPGEPRGPGIGGMPVVPSLPPMGDPRERRPGGERPPGPPRTGERQDGDRPAWPPSPETTAGADRPGSAAGGDFGPRGGPVPGRWAGILWVDYGVRIAAIGVFAWFAARWLSAPMRRLAEASEQLGGSLGRGHAVVALDERGGTLEVRQTAQVFNAMAQRLHAQFNAQALLMATISHDLRTPLARLRLRLEAMDAQPQTERCIADVQEMDMLIGSVLELLRDDAGHRERLRIDVGALLQSLVDDLVEQGEPVVLVGPTVSATVLAQPAALNRILGNLVGNALRHGGSARVSAALAGGEVVVTVDDDGPGIAPALLGAVFEPFYRVDALRSRASGSGLGLYIARDLAERNGGTVTLANRAEGGLRASLAMPAA